MPYSAAARKMMMEKSKMNSPMKMLKKTFVDRPIEDAKNVVGDLKNKYDKSWDKWKQSPRYKKGIENIKMGRI